jgi:hypothetical protein
MKEIPLTQGKVALVDDSDYERVSVLMWRAQWDGHNWYARHGKPRRGPVGLVFMHRFILGLTSGDQDVDHINGNGLDNRRNNLRIATQKQNSRNRRIPITNRTGFKGVQVNRYCKRTQMPYLATIKVNGKRIWMGPFATAEEAAHAYDAKARELFGEFARCNFSEVAA